VRERERWRGREWMPFFRFSWLVGEREGQRARENEEERSRRHFPREERKNPVPLSRPFLLE
jgi:hypothetical protein